MAYYMKGSPIKRGEIQSKDLMNSVRSNPLKTMHDKKTYVIPADNTGGGWHGTKTYVPPPPTEGEGISYVTGDDGTKYPIQKIGKIEPVYGVMPDIFGVGRWKYGLKYGKDIVKGIYNFFKNPGKTKKVIDAVKSEADLIKNVPSQVTKNVKNYVVKNPGKSAAAGTYVVGNTGLEVAEKITEKKQDKVSAEVGKIASSEKVTYTEAVNRAKEEGVDLPKIINERDNIQMNIGNENFDLNFKNIKDWQQYRDNDDNAETLDKIYKIANKNKDYKLKKEYIDKMYTHVKGPGADVASDTTGGGAWNMVPIEITY
jgi:hypothetical protein